MRPKPDFLNPAPGGDETAPYPGTARRAVQPPLTRAQDIALTAMLVLQCLTLFVAAPFAALGYAVPRYSLDLLVLAFVSLVVMVSRQRTIAVIAIAGAACGLAGATGRLVDLSNSTTLLLHVGGLIGVLVPGGIVARALFAPGPVTIHRVIGAVVLYLSMALGFSMAYRIIGDIVPDAFAGVSFHGDNLRSAVGMIYFSFVTLTSTGFGDIVPVHPIARSLANLEAVFGQLYPATLVAVLVSQHLETRAGRRGNAARGDRS